MSLKNLFERCDGILKAKSGIGIVTRNGKNFVSNSPAATGIPNKYVMGQTRSGKNVMSLPEHPKHQGFSKEDHLDAYEMHGKHMASLEPKFTHPGLIEHHKKAADYHMQAAQGAK